MASTATCLRAAGGFCHPSDVRGHCLLKPEFECLGFQALSGDVHLVGTHVASARPFMGTYSLVCLNGPVEIGADIKVWRDSAEPRLVDNSACFLGGRAIYAHVDDSSQVMWYGDQTALGGPHRLRGSVYADNGAAWNVGSIERVCTEEDECRLSAVPHLRVHDSAYLPEQIGWKFSTLWQRGVGDSAWLAWDASASCWVHDGGVRTQAGSMPLTSERLALYCVLGAVVGAFLGLEHPIANRLRGGGRVLQRAVEGLFPLGPACCRANLLLALFLLGVCAVGW